MGKMNVEYLKTEDIKPYENSPRTMLLLTDGKNSRGKMLKN